MMQTRFCGINHSPFYSNSSVFSFLSQIIKCINFFRRSQNKHLHLQKKTAVGKEKPSFAINYVCRAVAVWEINLKNLTVKRAKGADVTPRKIKIFLRLGNSTQCFNLGTLCYNSCVQCCKWEKHCYKMAEHCYIGGLNNVTT